MSRSVESSHEASVDLDLVKREPPQVAEAGIAGAEVMATPMALIVRNSAMIAHCHREGESP
jgi:hypothetical protein